MRLAVVSSLRLAMTIAVIAQAMACQTAPPRGHWEFVHVRSGVHANPMPVEGVVWRDFVTLPPGTPWLRLYFAKAFLDKGSMLRIASLRDGDVMTMRQEHLEQWSYSSCYFNGNAVMIELVAGPGTQKNHVEIDKVMAGDLGAGVGEPDTICGGTDDRVTATDTRIGRIFDGGCTGWIFDFPAASPDKGHLSAGHCAAAGQVLQFNVPQSAANCSAVHPPASRQFAIDFANSQFQNGGIGNDYWVFNCFRNPVTGLSSFETQGSAMLLAVSMPILGAFATVRGYGLDGSDVDGAGGGTGPNCTCTPASGTGTRNQVLQSASGPTTSFAGTTARYQADTCGGNSGSPVLTGTAFAIHTHGGCTDPLGTSNNAGTEITHPGLQAAIAAVCTGTLLADHDHCFAALPVVSGTNGTFSNVGATASSPVFSCHLGGGSDVWFAYVAPCSGTVTFDTCSANRTFDTVMEVWDGCVGGTLLGCNDDMGGSCNVGAIPTAYASRVTVNVSVGARYLIRVGGFVGTTGNFDLRVTPCGIADACADAVPLSHGLNGPFTTEGSFTSAPQWLCAAGGNDVWFRYQTSANTSRVTFSTCDGANFDTAIQVFTGNGCGSLTSIGCNDDAGGACGLRSLVTVPVTGAADLYVRVGGFSGATGDFMLSVAEVQANDECSGAIAVVNGANGVFTNRETTTSGPAWPCGSGGSDVWFSYTATFTGRLLVSTCTAARTYDTTLQVFTGGCSGLTSLACNDDACGPGSSLIVSVNRNATYLIRVGGASSRRGEFELVLGGTAANDHCFNAVTVTTGVNGPFTNVDSITSAPAWPCGTGANDVWFRYTASCTSPHTFTTCGPSLTYDTTIEVFAGDCAAPVSLGCNDDWCSSGSGVTVDLANGQTCLVRVGGVRGATGSFDLTVEPGTGTGSFLTLQHGCGPMSIVVGGQPRIGGTISTTIAGAGTGLPFIGLGFLPSAPFCGCTVGHSWTSANFGTGHSLFVPCDPVFIGNVLGIQGAGLLTPGGCAAPQISFTDTVLVRIG